jgi:hypothetical protein
MKLPKFSIKDAKKFVPSFRTTVIILVVILLFVLVVVMRKGQTKENYKYKQNNNIIKTCSKYHNRNTMNSEAARASDGFNPLFRGMILAFEDGGNENGGNPVLWQYTGASGQKSTTNASDWTRFAKCATGLTNNDGPFSWNTGPGFGGASQQPASAPVPAADVSQQTAVQNTAVTNPVVADTAVTNPVVADTAVTDTVPAASAQSTDSKKKNINKKLKKQINELEEKNKGLTKLAADAVAAVGEAVGTAIDTVTDLFATNKNEEVSRVAAQRKTDYGINDTPPNFTKFIYRPVALELASCKYYLSAVANCGNSKSVDLYHFTGSNQLWAFTPSKLIKDTYTIQTVSANGCAARYLTASPPGNNDCTLENSNVYFGTHSDTDTNSYKSLWFVEFDHGGFLIRNVARKALNCNLDTLGTEIACTYAGGAGQMKVVERNSKSYAKVFNIVQFTPKTAPDLSCNFQVFQHGRFNSENTGGWHKIYKCDYGKDIEMDSNKRSDDGDNEMGASSWIVPKGHAVQMFNHKGDSRIFSAGNYKVVPEGWNDVLQKFRIYKATDEFVKNTSMETPNNHEENTFHS